MKKLLKLLPLCLLLGCSSSNEVIHWKLQAYQMFAKNMQLLITIDSLEQELYDCSNIKKMMVKK